MIWTPFLLHWEALFWTLTRTKSSRVSFGICSLFKISQLSPLTTRLHQPKIYAISWLVRTSTHTRCLKLTEKVSFNIASEARNVYNLSGQKFIKNAKNGQFWRFFGNLKMRLFWWFSTTVNVVILSILESEMTNFKVTFWNQIQISWLWNSVLSKAPWCNG